MFPPLTIFILSALSAGGGRGQGLIQVNQEVRVDELQTVLSKTWIGAEDFYRV